MKPAIVISPRDNVATALEPLPVGMTLTVDDRTVLVTQRIPSGHKVALVDIEPGAPVLKYGCPIGPASAFIQAGDHVHTHNVASTRGRGDLGAAAEFDREAL